jgi:hypothetical protein
MACPYFYPIERFDAKAWTKHPRLPLGDPYTGFCRVEIRDVMPDPETLRQFCNPGGSRACPRFPGKEAGPDSIRFSVTGDQNDRLKVFWVQSRDHTTVEHGVLEYSVSSSQFVNGSHPGELLRKQARAYVESYLRRKAEPETAKNPHRR